MEPGRVPVFHAHIIFRNNIEGETVVVIGEETGSVCHPGPGSQELVLSFRGSIGLNNF
jgi:hypothetical protein